MTQTPSRPQAAGEIRTLDSSTIRGVCHVFLAIDIGFAIDLTHAERLLSGDQVQLRLKRPRKAPDAAQFERRSARVVQPGPALDLGLGFMVEGTAEIALWEFGAAVVCFRIPLEAELRSLAQLSDRLWDNQELIADARRRAASVLAAITPAVTAPGLGNRVEDYVAFELRLPPGMTAAALCSEHAIKVASILRAEPEELSAEEVTDALAMRCAYLPNELILIDWFAAILVGDDMDDERLVLELSVAELLELRLLDEQLDRSVDAAYELFTRRRSWLASLRTRSEDLRHVSRLQADAAVLFEGVDNALKLLGDQYLARLYRLASSRFHLPQWDAAIERKLRVLDGIYEKLASQAASRRFEVLEIVIVVLIAISTLTPFIPQLWP